MYMNVHKVRVLYMEQSLVVVDLHIICCFAVHMFVLPDWAASNYPKPRTNTSLWLHKAIDRSVSTEYMYTCVLHVHVYTCTCTCVC